MKLITVYLTVLLSIIQLSLGIDECLPTSKCNNIISCSDKGHCFYDIGAILSTNSTDTSSSVDFISCICDRGYTTGENDNIKCCYKRKSQFSAFLIEFIVGFGAGHFFIGNNLLGTIKLCFVGLACCSCCLIGFCFCYKTNRHDDEPSPKQKMLNVAFLSGICVYLTWQAVDIILFGINFYKDGNGVELETW